MFKSMKVAVEPHLTPKTHTPTPTKNFWSKFQLQEQIGLGYSGRVFKVTRSTDKQIFALKVMPRTNKWNPTLFKQEIKFLTMIQHPNVIKFEDSFIDDTYFYICMQLCLDSLSDRLLNSSRFSENTASKIILNVLKAINFCHSHNIVHRDIKPENILYKTNETNSNVVISDWGEAMIIDDNQTYSDSAGTTIYNGPECIRNRKGWELKKMDMWAIGVTTYILVTGKFPFTGNTRKKLVKKMEAQNFKWDRRQVSHSCRNFIESLLKIDSKERFNAEQALNHPWIKQAGFSKIIV